MPSSPSQQHTSFDTTDTPNAGKRALLLTTASLLWLPRKTLAVSSQDADFWTIPRSVRVINAHTGQRQEFQYWRDGTTIQTEYEALCTLCRDHHSGHAAYISLRTINLMYASQEWYWRVTRKRATTILSSAYRTSETNHRAGGSVDSYHLEGRALDGWMDGISLQTFAKTLLYARAGGVGVYRKHIHWDDGPFRYWEN
ncbi:MAG: DUF882 domain-containing protein [Betaproteobacteria bacterium]|nr:DUF882 domain-containing protein [Betaproteobacteria bacterium]